MHFSLFCVAIDSSNQALLGALKLNYEIKRNIFDNSGILFIAYSNVFIKLKLNYD